LLVQKMVNKIREEVKVTPEDLREVRASHILLTTEAEAKQILGRVKKGEDFVKLARQYSKDPGSAAKGGDLGYFAFGRMIEAFSKVAFKLKVGEVSDVVKSDFGYHIIKLMDSRLRKFEGAEKDVEKAALAEKQQSAYQKWYSELRGKAKVDVVNPEMKGHRLRFSGRAIEAVVEYKKAIGENPANAYLHVFLADTFAGLGKMDEALTEYERAVAMEGGNFELYLILAKAYERAGRKDQALEQYRKASLVAGDNKALHEELLKIFQGLKSGKDTTREKSEIARIAKKEAFEKKLQGK